MSRDFDGNKAFYHAVFGYEYGDMSSEGSGTPRSTSTARQVGGIGELGSDFPAEVPAALVAYFAVARHRRGRRDGHRARRQRGPARLGQPLRADGRAGRRPGRGVLADGQRARRPASLTRLTSRGPAGFRARSTRTWARPASCRSAVRSAVPRAQRPVVTRPTTRIATPQPAMIHQPTWLASAKPTRSGRAGPRATADPDHRDARATVPTCRLVEAIAAATPAWDARHAGHRGVGDRRVHHARPRCRTPRRLGISQADRRAGREPGQHEPAGRSSRCPATTQRQPRAPRGRRCGRTAARAARSSPPAAACTAPRAAAE